MQSESRLPRVWMEKLNISEGKIRTRRTELRVPETVSNGSGCIVAHKLFSMAMSVFNGKIQNLFGCHGWIKVQIKELWKESKGWRGCEKKTKIDRKGSQQLDNVHCIRRLLLAPWLPFDDSQPGWLSFSSEKVTFFLYISQHRFLWFPGTMPNMLHFWLGAIWFYLYFLSFVGLVPDLSTTAVRSHFQ